jgi:hypothetical protein
MSRFRFYHVVLAGLLLVTVVACWPEPDEPIPAALVPMIVAARRDPAATVSLFYEFFIQKEYAATGALVTSEFVTSLSHGRLSYAEVQRRQDKTLGYVLKYEILAVRYPDPTTAHVDIDIEPDSSMPSEETIFLIKGPDGWRISGGRSRDIVP